MRAVWVNYLRSERSELPVAEQVWAPELMDPSCNQPLEPSPSLRTASIIAQRGMTWWKINPTTEGWSRRKNVCCFRIRELSRVMEPTPRRKSTEKDRVPGGEKCWQAHSCGESISRISSRRGILDVTSLPP